VDPAVAAVRAVIFTTKSAPGSAAARRIRLGKLWKLVGKLHRYAAAERMSHQGRPFVPERDQQVTQPRGVRAK
jgi:hypothetical protein